MPSFLGTVFRLRNPRRSKGGPKNTVFPCSYSCLGGQKVGTVVSIKMVHAIFQVLRIFHAISTLRIRRKAIARRENWTIPRQRVLPARSPHPAFNPTVDKPPGGGRSRNRVWSSIFRGHHSRGRTYTILGSNEGDQASKDVHSRGAQGCTGSHPPRALTNPCALTRPTKKKRWVGRGVRGGL